MVFFEATTTRTMHVNRIEHLPDIGRIAVLAGNDKNGLRQAVPIDA